MSIKVLLLYIYIYHQAKYELYFCILALCTVLALAKKEFLRFKCIYVCICIYRYRWMPTHVCIYIYIYMYVQKIRQHMNGATIMIYANMTMSCLYQIVPFMYSMYPPLWAINFFKKSCWVTNAHPIEWYQIQWTGTEVILLSLEIMIDQFVGYWC